MKLQCCSHSESFVPVLLSLSTLSSNVFIDFYFNCFKNNHKSKEIVLITISGKLQFRLRSEFKSA